MADMNYIECFNDDCIHWRNHGRCGYYKTGYCVEITNYNGMPICNSFEKEEVENDNNRAD